MTKIVFILVTIQTFLTNGIYCQTDDKIKMSIAYEYSTLFEEFESKIMCESISEFDLHWTVDKIDVGSYFKHRGGQNMIIEKYYLRLDSVQNNKLNSPMFKYPEIDFVVGVFYNTEGEIVGVYKLKGFTTIDYTSFCKVLQSIYYLDNLRDVELKLGGIFHIDFKCLRKAKNYHLVKGYVIPLREAIMKGEDIRKYWSIKI